MVRFLRRPRHRSGHSHGEPFFLLLPSLTEKEELSAKIPGVGDHQGHLHPPTPAKPGIPATPVVWPICISPGESPAQDTEHRQLQNLCPTALPTPDRGADDRSQRMADRKEAPYQHRDLAQ